MDLDKLWKWSCSIEKFIISTLPSGVYYARDTEVTQMKYLPFKFTIW